MSAEWTQVEVIDLLNDGSGLGFGIIGGRSTGVVIKTILPGGIAERVRYDEGRWNSYQQMFALNFLNIEADILKF